jgi:hypothetical protein
LSTSDNVALVADPSGAFFSRNLLPELADGTGELGIEVTDTVAGEKQSERAEWNGEAWIVF